MNKSVFWARVIGFYCIIMSIWLFIDGKNYQLFMTDLINQHSILVLAVVFTLFLGLAIVISHSIWRGWPIIVTILGYWIIFKGMILLFFPQWVNKIITFWQGTYSFTYGVPALIIGLVLLFCGYFLKHKAN